MIKDISLDDADPTEIFLVLQNTDHTKLSVPLKSSRMQVEISGDAIAKIRKILELWGSKRKDIVEYYLKENRERDGFVYDLLALAYYTSQLQVEHDHLLGSWNATDLLHDRVVAQLLYELSQIGYAVETMISNPIGNKHHDFNVSIYRCEVKSLRIQVDAPLRLAGVWLEGESRNRISAKFRQEFHNALLQVGDDGIVYMSALSTNLNALLRGYFKNRISSSVPPPEAGTVVLVLSTPKPFKDAYLIFPMVQFLSAIEQAVSDTQAFGIRSFTMFGRWPFQLTTAAVAGSNASFTAKGN